VAPTPPKPPARPSGLAGIVAWGLVVLAALLDGFVLLPGFENGRGSPGAAIASWLVVNLTPAIVTCVLLRREGHAWPSVLGRTFLIASATGVAIVISLALYIGANGGLD
jgi:hypothetical protein